MRPSARVVTLFIGFFLALTSLVAQVSTTALRGTDPNIPLPPGARGGVTAQFLAPYEGDYEIRAGGNPERAIMVGDSIADIRTARAANVPVVAVDFGYSEVPVRELQPDEIISHFNSLEGSVRRLLAALADRDPSPAAAPAAHR